MSVILKKTKLLEMQNRIYRKIFLKGLTRSPSHGILKPWQGLALRLSGAEEGTPPPIHIPRMWNLLRILRIERSIRRKPHLIVMGRKAAKTINKMLEMILNIFFAVLFSCADSGSFFIQKWR